jgi:Sec-independent protein translocase protein TatA
VFNVGPEKLILLFVILLVVMGPQRLPDVARTLGRTMVALRRLSGNLQAEMHGALGDPAEALTQALGSLREGVGTFRNEVGAVLTPTDPSPTTPLPDDPGLN